jgi:lysyl-tRNA synthetase class II
MAFHEEYLDVLQNIEFAIIQIYRQYPELHDYEVMSALEAAIDFYAAQRINRNPREFNLSDRAALVAENLKNVCNWRLGRKSLETTETYLKDLARDQAEFKPKNVEEIIACLKKVLGSVKKWNKQGGRQGYLSFVSAFIN